MTAFTAAIEDEELNHECCPQHLRLGTAKIKEDTERSVNMKRSTAGTKSLCLQLNNLPFLQIGGGKIKVCCIVRVMKSTMLVIKNWAKSKLISHLLCNLFIIFTWIHDSFVPIFINFQFHKSKMDLHYYLVQFNSINNYLRRYCIMLICYSLS